VLNKRTLAFISYYQKMTQADMNEWIDRFQIMKSYAETIRLVAWTNQQLAEKLSYVIIQYWIYGELPKWYDDPMLLAFFSQVKLPIDKCRAKSWNAKKTYEKALNQNEIKTKSNENQTERKDKKEKIKNKKENKERKWYGEFKKCYLTDEQYQRVLEKYWTKQWEYLIKEVDNYCASKWKKYDNYLAAINTFAKKEWIKEQIPKKENESWIYDLPF
jgi:hypothetical protein